MEIGWMEGMMERKGKDMIGWFCFVCWMFVVLLKDWLGGI
jgi:hypothetical protein